jgi:hypothetical protein
MAASTKSRVVDTTTDPAQAQQMKREYTFALLKTRDAGRWKVVVEHHRTNARRGGCFYIVLQPTAQR